MGLSMSKNKKCSITFITLVLLFFVPSIPWIAELMTSIWPLSLATYWIVLTIVAVAIGLRAIKGVE